MENNILGYVIHSSYNDKYLSYGDNDSGYPCWVSTIKFAHFFNSIEKAFQELETKEFSKQHTSFDGVVYPPIMLQNACDLKASKNTGETIISVFPVILDIDNVKLSMKIKAEIKKPKCVKYFY
jgi:hypothetical protein